jgi:hypothetical protein
MGDLIARLRTRNGSPTGFGLGPVCDEAADEIERLRAALQEADTIMGHDEAFTEWREKWAGLWPSARLT